MDEPARALSSLAALVHDPVLVTYTASEDVAYDWVTSNIYGPNHSPSLSTRSTSRPTGARSRPSVATRRAVLVLLLTFFEPAWPGTDAAFCLGRLVRDSRATLVGVDIKRDLAKLLSGLPQAPGEANTSVLGKVVDLRKEAELLLPDLSRSLASSASRH